MVTEAGYYALSIERDAFAAPDEAPDETGRPARGSASVGALRAARVVFRLVPRVFREVGRDLGDGRPWTPALDGPDVRDPTARRRRGSRGTCSPRRRQRGRLGLVAPTLRGGRAVFARARQRWTVASPVWAGRRLGWEGILSRHSGYRRVELAGPSNGRTRPHWLSVPKLRQSAILQDCNRGLNRTAVAREIVRGRCGASPRDEQPGRRRLDRHDLTRGQQPPNRDGKRFGVWRPFEERSHGRA